MVQQKSNYVDVRGIVKSIELDDDGEWIRLRIISSTGTPKTGDILRVFVPAIIDYLEEGVLLRGSLVKRHGPKGVVYSMLPIKG